ncbi:hypothetical protein B0G83_106183 [Paraburkholderia sp. BL21I4N1]|nr:hypothetical protein B0G83_106183 [Paraburkholderia sp. BL21I4N1]
MEAHPLSDAAQRTLSAWHDLLQRNAMDELDPLLADTIVFRSPVAHTSYPGKAAIRLILKTVNGVFRQFEYHRPSTTAVSSAKTAAAWCWNSAPKSTANR